MNKVSVIVPIGSIRQWLQECINSITSQITPNGMELILVNNTGNPLPKLNFNGIVPIIVEEERRGLSFAMNTAFEKVSGDYFTFLADDDKFARSDALYDLSCEMESAEDEIKAIYSLYESINFNSNYFATSSKLRDYLLDHRKIYWKHIHYGGGFFVMGCAFYKKEVLDSGIRFNTKITRGEEFLFNLQILKEGGVFQAYNSVTHLLRTHSMNKSRKRVSENKKAFRSRRGIEMGNLYKELNAITTERLK